MGGRRQHRMKCAQRGGSDRDRGVRTTRVGKRVGMGHWKKHGLISTAPERAPWYALAMMMPFVDEARPGPNVRVYFSGSDGDGRARIGYLVSDLGANGAVRSVSKQPVLDLGPLGAYDDSGVLGGCIVTHQDK